MASHLLLVFVLSYFTSLSAHASPLHDRQARTLRYNVLDAYNVDFGSSAGGGCGGPYENKVKTGYSDAIDMLNAAIQAIDDMRQPIPDKSDRAGRNEWKRKAQPFEALFGEQMQRGQGISTTAQGIQSMLCALIKELFLTTQLTSTVRTAKFIDIRNWHLNTNPALPKILWLQCTDAWLRYLSPTDIDPTDPGRQQTVANSKSSNSASHLATLHTDIREDPAVQAANSQGTGIYYADSAPNRRLWWWWPGATPNMANPVCERDDNHQDLAVTEPRGYALLITMCQAQFEIDEWSAYDMNVQAPRLQIPRLREGTDIEDISQTVGQTWVHEMVHLVHKCTFTHY